MEQKPPEYNHNIQPPQQSNPYETINQLTLHIQQLQLQQQQLTLQNQQAMCQSNTLCQDNLAQQFNMPQDVTALAGHQQPQHQQYPQRRQTAYHSDPEVQEDVQPHQIPSEEKVLWITPKQKNQKTPIQMKRTSITCQELTTLQKLKSNNFQ